MPTALVCLHTSGHTTASEGVTGLVLAQEECAIRFGDDWWFLSLLMATLRPLTASCSSFLHLVHGLLECFLHRQAESRVGSPRCLPHFPSHLPSDLSLPAHEPRAHPPCVHVLSSSPICLAHGSLTALAVLPYAFARSVATITSSADLRFDFPDLRTADCHLSLSGLHLRSFPLLSRFLFSVASLRSLSFTVPFSFFGALSWRSPPSS